MYKLIQYLPALEYLLVFPAWSTFDNSRHYSVHLDLIGWLPRLRNWDPSILLKSNDIVSVQELTFWAWAQSYVLKPFLCVLFKGSLCRYAGGPSPCLQRGCGGISSSSHGCPSIKSLKSYINQYIGLSGPPASFQYLYTAKEGQMPIHVLVLFRTLEG